jgi:peptide/nickel transport system substrate-binding protein
MRWQILIVVLALVAIGVLLLDQQPVIQPQQVAQVQPTSGGSYTEALIGSFGRLNPVLDYYNQPDRDINRLIYSSLIKFDDRGQPYGDLAESWGISQDGTVYNFSLKPDAVWHDGKPVTSDDVIFTVQYLKDENIPIPDELREYWSQVEVHKLDDKTLQFRLPEPYAPFLDHLTFGILPEHILNDVSAADLVNAEFNMKPVGSGPFKFDEISSENGQIAGVELSAFDDYFGDKPFIETVSFSYFPDAQAALAAYQNGDVQGISHITPDVLSQALKIENLNLFTGRLPQLTLIYMNLDHEDTPFFQDASIRRALLMGLNRQGMIDRLVNGQAMIADGPIFPGSWAYYEGNERIEYDPDKALAVIKEAGYTIPAEGNPVREKDGIPFSFELVHPDTPIHTALAEAVQKDWAKLGVNAELKAVPYDELVDEYLEPRSYQAALVDLNLHRSPDPDPYPFWDQAQISEGQNYAMWNDRQASEYLERARVITDVAERAKAYRNFQVRFTQDMPALPLYYPVYSYAVDGQVQGVSMGPLFDLSDRLNSIKSWYLVAGRPSAGQAAAEQPADTQPVETPAGTNTP